MKSEIKSFEQYTQVLFQCTAWGNQTVRESRFFHPIETKHYIAGTDGCLCTVVNRRWIPSQSSYECDNRNITNKIDRMFKESSDIEYLNVISLNDLKAVVEKRDNMYSDKHSPENYTYCPECRGSGKVYWHYKEHSKMDECPVCHGSGSGKSSEEIEKMRIYGDMPPYIGLYNVGQKDRIVYFNAIELRKIINSLEILGEDELWFTVRDRILYFKLDDYCYGMCSNWYVDVEDDYIDATNIKPLIR